MDNTTLNAGSGGDTIRTLDDGSVKWPVGVTAFATSVSSPDVLAIVTPAAGLPVRLADGSGYLTTLPVSLASVPSHEVTNAGTFAVQASQAGTWTVTGTGGTFPVTDSGGSLTVDDGGGSLTVDGTVAVSGAVAVTGTFWPDTQPVSGPLTDTELRASAVPVSLAAVPAHDVTNAGTFAVQVTSAPTTTVTGTVTADAGSGTFAVSAAALPLPTGAATESTLSSLNGKVTACNTGAVVVSSSALPSGAATSAKQPALGTAGTASADVITVQGIASMTALKVDGSAVTQPVSDGGGSLTVDGTVAATQSGTWTVGLSAAQTLATVTTVGTVTTITNAVHVDDNSGSLTVDAPVGTPVFVRLSDGSSAISTLPVSLASVPSHAVTNAGTFAVQAAQSGTWTVQPGNTANTTPWLTSEQAATAGGCSLYSFLSTAAVQAANVKNGAGQVYGLHFFNKGTSPVYVRLYNQTTAPASGDTPVYRAIVPGNTSGTGFVVNVPPGVAFGTGIGVRVSAAIADNDATALNANEVLGNILYK